jgi:hypothetical protein
MIWLIVSTSTVPTVDPYISRSKRPPRYLERFLAWLNATIDETVVKLAPRIIVCRSTTTCRLFVKSFVTGHPSNQWKHAHQRFTYAHQRFTYALHLTWRFISCQRHFESWRSRHRPTTSRRHRTTRFISCQRRFESWRSRHRPTTSRRHRTTACPRQLAMSAITAGIARAHQATCSRPVRQYKPLRRRT